MKIIVLGAGLVPRVGGIAPIRKPFEANENLIRLILGHGSLKPYKVNEDGSKTEVTYKNYKLLLANENASVKATAKSVAPEKKPEPVKEAPKAAPVVKPVEQKPVEEKKEEKPVQSTTITLDDVDNKKEWKNNKQQFKPNQNQNQEKKED